MNRKPLFKIFLFRRRPKLGGIPAHWQQPTDPKEYEQRLYWEGFVSGRDLPEAVPTDGPPSTWAGDLNDLKVYLLPAFFEHHQRARSNQNQFYVLHWVLLFGALFAVFWGALGLYAVSEVGGELPSVCGIMAAIIGGITAYYAATEDTNELQHNWAVNRRIAEELRSHYFRYFTHMSPYDKEDRLRVLTESIINIEGKDTGQNVSLAESRIQRGFMLRAPHNAADLAFVFSFYTKSRLNNQAHYYRVRMDEAELNSNFVSRVVFLLLMTTVVLAAASILAQDSLQRILLVLVAFLPSATILLTCFRWIYGWERQATLYRDTATTLRQLSTTAEDLKSLPQVEQKVVLNRVVTAAEDAISAEVNQWGIFQGGLGHYQREGYLEVEPMFGIPPNEATFQCDVFMIMPFADEFASIYADHIKPFVQSDLQLNIKRGDDFFTAEHAIMNEVWAAIYMSHLVLVECTGRNANVYYELGIAHTLGKPAVMITQKIEDIPFDLRHLRHIVYENSEAGMEALKNQLRTAIRAVQ